MYTQVPEAELDLLLEEKLVFLVDATGIPVLLSLLVLIFTSGGEDLTKLPSNRIELYELGIESAINKRLQRGQRLRLCAPQLVGKHEEVPDARRLPSRRALHEFQCLAYTLSLVHPNDQRLLLLSHARTCSGTRVGRLRVSLLSRRTS